MAEGNGDVSKESTDRSQDYNNLISYGLDAKVAGKLDEIYQTGEYLEGSNSRRSELLTKNNGIIETEMNFSFNHSFLI